MHERQSFCRTCIAQCGVVVTVGDDGRIASLRADRSHPVSHGYACFKGLAAADTHNAPDRLLHAQRRRPDGGFERIPVEQALDEIAARLAVIRDRDGPDAIGLFRGTAGFHNSTAFGIHGSFLAALGSRSLFTTLTIDQSAKAISACRIGSWHAGRDHVDASDVALLFGSNPLVSHSAGGYLVSDPVKRLKQAIARGLTLIVVDPRLTETARFATLHLQPVPGEDATVAAGLLRIILSEGWHDAPFCERHVAGLEALRRAVEPFTPEHVQARAAIAPEPLRQAAMLFARDGRRGNVVSGTGPNMAARSNLAEHLIQAIGIVCGRFKRAGDLMPNADPLSPQRDWFAEVVPASAPWDAEPPSRIRGVGRLFGEKLTGTLAEEITTPGPGRIRALLVDGANIANSVPGRDAMMAALGQLELLVVIDPYQTPTARLADYVFAPRMQFERPDLPLTLGFPLHADAWAQYTPAIVEPPEGSELVDDWYVFWSLAKRLGLGLRYGRTELDMDQAPQTETLLACGLEGSAVSLDALKARPGQVVVQPAGPQIVQPARPGASARLQLDPPGVLGELEELALVPDPSADYPYRLISRRMRDVNGSIGIQAASVRARNPYNPLHLHPADMARCGIARGETVQIDSSDGRTIGIAEPDPTLREGVVSMSHNWSDETGGGSTNALIHPRHVFEALNAMPRMSAIPVRLRPLPPASRPSQALAAPLTIGVAG